jgi:hypothetical protein
MADKKISALTAASTPLAGTEVLPIVQSGSTVKVSVDNLTTGKSVSMKDFTANSGAANQECRLQYSDNGAGRTVILRMSSSSTAPFDGYGAYIKATQGGGVDVHSLAFGTTIGTPSDKLTVRYDGLVTVETDNLKIGTAGKGIDFSAATHAAGMTSELLNDYEEGTWTPASGVGVATSVSGVYTRIGRQVTVIGTLTFPVQVDAGVATITGLPFASGATGSGGSLRYTDFGNVFFLYGNPSASTISLFTAAGAGISYTSISGKRVDFMMTYFV